MTVETALLSGLDDFFRGRPAQRLGVAVSGGSDSLALLYLLTQRGCAEIEAVTVDHGLRAGSDAEARQVGAACARLGVPHRILNWDGREAQGNLQDRARRMRYGLIAGWARDRGLDCVALGHTRDDLAETFLMRLAREAGVDGLSAMAPVFTRAGMRFVRPLLGAARDDLRHYLSARGIGWIEDPTNADEDYDRVRARKALAALAPLGLGAREIAASAHNLSEARAALSTVAMQFAEERVKSAAGDLIFDRALLNRQPAEIRRRLLAGALRWVASAEYPPRRGPMADAEDAIAERRNVTLHGCRVMVSDMTVRIAREHAAVAGTVTATDALWDGRWRLEGPHAEDLHVAALGEAVKDCPEWRATGLPRATLLSSPAVWRGDRLVAAPVAGLPRGWSARAPGAADFAASLIVH